jgi:hypothetical protein
LIGFEKEMDELKDPQKMEAARREGPLSIRDQKRMVTVEDYARLLEAHPLVAQAHSWREWGGSWSVIRIAIIPWDDRFHLDDQEICFDSVRNKVADFHNSNKLTDPWLGKPTIRFILQYYLEAYRMVGQEVQLKDFVPVGINMTISAQIKDNYFQSEIKYAIEQALGRNPGGFFEPGRLKFGESIYIGDIVQTLMNIEGVAEVCLDPFKKIGKQFPNQSSEGFITLKELEVAVCDNDRSNPERGYYNLRLHGGRRG